MKNKIAIQIFITNLKKNNTELQKNPPVSSSPLVNFKNMAWRCDIFIFDKI